MVQTAAPGATLRALRRRNGWTLAHVAERSGIPVSTLSKIENDQASPSFDQLVRLSDGLQIDIAQLFSALKSPPLASSGGRRSINRTGDGKLIETPNQRLSYLNTDLLNKAFIPIIAEVHARSIEDYGEYQRHAGEEFLYVIEGAVELYTEQYAPVLLQTGESIYFDSSMGHAYVARGQGTCRTLSICTAPHLHIAHGTSSAAPATTADAEAEQAASS